ncbi:MAG: hypothetical protein VKP72_01210 [bacterium]|nr:hypothetical protein [bacterium]
MSVEMRANRLNGLPSLTGETGPVPRPVTGPGDAPVTSPPRAALPGRDLFGGTPAYLALSRQNPGQSWQARYVTGLVGGQTRAVTLPAHITSNASAQGVEEVAARIRLAVDAARSGLAGTDRAAFDRIRLALGSDRGAQVALEALLVSGRLNQTPRAHDGRSLLDTLEATLAETARPPLRMSDVIGDAVQMVADPAQVIQGLRNTCTAASLEVKLASEDPAEYLRLVGALAAGREVSLRGGEQLQPLSGSEQRDDSGRCDASRLFQDAVIQLQISEPGIRYVNPVTSPPGDYPEIFLAPGGQVLPPGRAGGGMTGSGQARALTLLSGKPHDYRSGKSGDTELLERIDRELAAGRSVPVTVHLGGKEQLQHAVTLTALSGPEPGERVYAAVITGRKVGTVTQTIPARELAGILVGATLPSPSA